MLIFGDSLTDQGNNSWVTTKGRHKSPGAPITNRPFKQKKRSYGKTWAQFLAPSLFQVQSSLPDATHQSTVLNFAWASAETGDNYINDLSSRPYDITKKCTRPGVVTPYKQRTYSCVPNLLTQIDMYLKNAHSNYPKPNKDTLVIIFAGSNDVCDNLFRLDPFKHEKNRNQMLLKKIEKANRNFMSKSLSDKFYLSHPIDNIVSAVTKLKKQGIPIENIVVVNLPNFAKMPLAKKTGDGILIPALHALSFLYNIGLKENLHKAGYSKIRILDIYSFLSNLTEHAKKYKFQNAETACTDDLSQLEACKGYVFFNGEHPTTATHRLMAKSFEQCLLHWFPERFPYHHVKRSDDAIPSSCQIKNTS